MKEQLRAYLNRYVQINTNELEKIFTLCDFQVFAKKEYLTKQDEKCKHYFFVLKGLVKQARVDESGNENISGFVSETPSMNLIQAIEETHAFLLTKRALEQLYIDVPQLEKVFRIIAEKTLAVLQRKHQIYMKASSRDRYYHLVEKIPGFAQRVPQYMIASYLEMTLEYLSEIRKKG